MSIQITKHEGESREEELRISSTYIKKQSIYVYI